MTRAFLSQTTFTAGELDPRMRGRTELRSFENGAARLRNVIVEPTGGVRRRPGLRHVATAEGEGRLVGLETGPDQAYVLAFSDQRSTSTATAPGRRWSRHRGRSIRSPRSRGHSVAPR